jgi:glycosyltransferase involved in cell wall biosynthesis
MTARIALSHDYLLVMRGAERTFLEIALEYPDAPITTLLYNAYGVHPEFARRAMNVSKIQHLGVRQSNFRKLLPIMPLAARSLQVQPSDVVIASSSAFAHGFKVEPTATLICYCHSPFRYAWHERSRALLEAPPGTRQALNLVLGAIRRWDLSVQGRVDHMIANSTITRSRIQSLWDRDAVVLHPPVSTERFAPAEPEDYFLIVCELVPHKRVDRALRAARLARRKVKVVGSGPDERRLRTEYEDVAQFLGRVPDNELAVLYSHALAVIVPDVEEFGIVAVEAQAAGRPVVGSQIGGTAETVLDGESGVLLNIESEADLAETLQYVDFLRFDPAASVRSAERFSTARFRSGLRELVRSWTPG